jgi:hypothetical protein
MAKEKSIEEQMADMQAENVRLAAQYKALQAATAKENVIVYVASSSVTLTIRSTTGTERKVKVTPKLAKTIIVDIEQGWNAKVDSDALIAQANGKATEEQLAENPLLVEMGTEGAISFLEQLVKIKYAYLEVANA